MADVSAISYPPKLEESERELRAGRRAQWSAQPGNSVDASCGLAISGGGIRSATFALGFLQAMAGRGLFRYLDYLSTVSGGSYIGGFLGALFHRAEDPRQAEATLADRRSPVVNWLRENGRYLSPGGASDGWAALSVVLRGVVAVNIVMWVMTLTIFLVLDALRGVFIHPGDPEWVKHVEDRLSAGPIWWSPGLFVPVVVFALGLLPLGSLTGACPGVKTRSPGAPASHREWLRGCGPAPGASFAGVAAVRHSSRTSWRTRSSPWSTRGFAEARSGTRKRWSWPYSSSARTCSLDSGREQRRSPRP
jgi:hypothetical protein